jgi:hypothetical protein
LLSGDLSRRAIATGQVIDGCIAASFTVQASLGATFELRLLACRTTLARSLGQCRKRPERTVNAEPIDELLAERTETALTEDVLLPLWAVLTKVRLFEAR